MSAKRTDSTGWKPGDDLFAGLPEPGASLVAPVVARMRAEGRDDAAILEAIHLKAESAKLLASEDAPAPGSQSEADARYAIYLATGTRSPLKLEMLKEALQLEEVLAEVKRRVAANAAALLDVERPDVCARAPVASWMTPTDRNAPGGLRSISSPGRWISLPAQKGQKPQTTGRHGISRTPPC